MNLVEYIGYHGTTSINKDNILTNGFTYNHRDDHWLGQGIYFLTEEYLAKQWAIQKALNTDNEKPIVIVSLIQAEQDKILDLTKIHQYLMFVQFSMEFNAALKTYYPDKDIILCKKHYLGCLVCDAYKEKYDIEIIVSSFPKSISKYFNTPYDNKNIMELIEIPYGEVQICVSSNKNIMMTDIIE